MLFGGHLNSDAKIQVRLKKKKISSVTLFNKFNIESEHIKAVNITKN